MDQVSRNIVTLEAAVVRAKERVLALEAQLKNLKDQPPKDGFSFLSEYELVTPKWTERRAEQAALVAEKETLFAEVDAALKAARKLLAELEDEIAVGDKYRHKQYSDGTVYTVEIVTTKDICFSYISHGEKYLSATQRHIVEMYWVRVVE